LLWSPNTQLLYPFENQANDYSGNARHGTVNGSGVYATRPNAGRCLYFDGTGDYVATPSFGLPATDQVVWFTCNIRSNAHTSTQCILGDASGSGTVGFLRITRNLDSTSLYWYYANGTSAKAAIAPDYFIDDTWLHLLVVCDYTGKLVHFYRNATPFGSPVAMTGTPVFPSSSRVLYVGSVTATTYLLTNGYLQNVYLGTLATCPPVAALTANANRMMLGLHPI
jgi:hypothetical protein